MQTFLPYPDFTRSAECLDNRRLGKQRVEAQQILNALLGLSRGWVNHPAVKMWRGHERALMAYRDACISEWVARSYVNNMRTGGWRGRVKMPAWLGDAAFHASHRSNLLRKDHDYYGRFGWVEGPDLPYVWPIIGAEGTNLLH